MGKAPCSSEVNVARFNHEQARLHQALLFKVGERQSDIGSE